MENENSRWANSGWGLSANALKRHFFPVSGERSLCGKWKSYKGQTFDRNYGNDGPKICAVCKRKLLARQKKGV